jgi:peptide/nickel transport system substrate-binding protein
MIKFETTIATLTIGIAISLSGAAAAENVLRYTSVSGGPVTIDPHSSGLIADRAATMQVYEQLIDIDSNLKIVPQLAVAWKPLNPDAWEFKLRRDVRFHDGTAFTVEDVVFSIERARAKASEFQEQVANIEAVEAINDHTVRITTTTPDPLLWMRLGSVAIMSKTWSETHNVETPGERYGEETYASRHANGTGPFVLEAFEPHGSWVMIRNADWWGRAANPINIERIVHSWSSDEDNLAALLDGEIHVLQAPPFSGLNAIHRNPDLKLVYRPKLQTFFFGFDQGSGELRSSNIKGKNPFQDKRVRQAVAHAINMETVLRRLMGELFIPAGMMIAPGVNGYAPEMDQPINYDPDRARALLLEAGYPDGFSITLDCPSEWGDDEITECNAAAKQLLAVGIEVAINYLSADDLGTKVEAQRQSDFFLESWQSDPDSEGLLRELFQSQSRYNLARYANPRIDELIEKIKIDMVTYARDAYLAEAWQIVTDDVVYLPIRHGVSVFAMRENLEIPPDPWDVPRFRLARFKEGNKSAQQK